MRITVSDGNPGREESRFLTADAILRYLLGESGKLESMIICNPGSACLSTTDYELYQAFGSLKSYDDVPRARITKFLENVEIRSYRKESGREKKILTHERVDKLRKNAINKGDKNEQSNRN